MILRDRSIRDAIEAGIIGCDPKPNWETQLQPASLDLRLGDEFSAFKDKSIWNQTYSERDGCGELGITPGKTNVQGLMTSLIFGGVKNSKGPFIERGEFMLATTLETIRIPKDMVGRVEGRSTLARLGLVVHVTAGFIDPGFEGQITLEMVNFGPHRIYLKPGMRICQVCFEKLDAPAQKPYAGKYQGQRGVTVSRTHLDEA